MMRDSTEEPSPITARAIDLISEVKELQRFNSQELSKLLKDSENLSLFHITANGLSVQIEMEKLVRFLPLHLTAVLLSSQRDEASLRYLLSGIRLLHSLCEVASRYSKLEQILLDDLKVSEQLLDLVFYLLIICCQQEYSFSGAMPLLFSALGACSMYLLTTCISSHWNELAYVLLAHPKVDIFVDAAFGAVRLTINFLQIKLSEEKSDFHLNSCPADEKAFNFCCQQCEGSLQFLQSLCQNKSFRERLLRNKELCGKGGLLRLVQATLKLNISPNLKEHLAVVAAVSRLKARVLSILLHLCESESVSYLDEVASIPESLDLAKSVAVEITDLQLKWELRFGSDPIDERSYYLSDARVISLLKTMVNRDLKLLENHSGKIYPGGFLQLNALRLTDIFSDDSNFRSYITIYFAEVLAAILSVPYQPFLSSWCSSDLPLKEEDASLEYEPFTMAGWILDSSSTLDMLNAKSCESNLIPSNNAQAPYAHHRTSLLVKVIANLHCFVPKICKEQERNFFLHKFLERLKMDWQHPQAAFTFNCAPQKAATICKNLRSLLGHAESLIPTFLNEEDVQLLRLFFTQLQSLIGPADHEVNRALELQNPRGFTLLQGNVDLDHRNRHSNLREGTSENTAFPGVDDSPAKVELNAEAVGGMHNQQICQKKSVKTFVEDLAETDEVHNAENSGSDLSSTRGKNPIDELGNGENTKPSGRFHRGVVGGIKEDERVESVNCEEKQVRKRKRPIMNDKQVSIIERALLEEPDMHKNSASLQSWAGKLSFHGSEVTISQLKNWLNNRKAKLARAAKDGRPSSEENAITDKQVASIKRTTSDSTESRMDELPASAASLDHCQVLGVGRTSSVSQTPLTARAESSSRSKKKTECLTSNASCVNFDAGQAVVLTDPEGKEIAKGTVYQVEGDWQGCNLADTKTCVVDITELRSERVVRLPHPSIEAGSTFEQAEVKIGTMRVLWDSGRMLKR